MIVVQMSFTISIKDSHDLSYHWTQRVYIQPDWLSTSLCLSSSPLIDIKIWYGLIRAPRLVHDKDHGSNCGADRDSGNAAWNSGWNIFSMVLVSSTQVKMTCFFWCLNNMLHPCLFFYEAPGLYPAIFGKGPWPKLGKKNQLKVKLGKY